MNWEAVGAIGEFVGGIVVVATLIYFGRQLRQSNRHAEATAYVEWSTSWNALLNELVSEEKVQNAIRAGFKNFKSLNKNDQAIFHMRMGAIVNHWLVAGELHEKGLIPDELYEGCFDFVVALLSTPGGLQYWEIDAALTPKGTELLETIKSGRRNVKPITEVLPWWSE